MINKIVIDTRGRWDRNSAIGTKVFLNGEELHGVTCISTDHEVDSIPSATIVLNAEVVIVNDNYGKEDFCDGCGCYDPTQDKHCNRQMGSKCMRGKSDAN